MRKVKNPETHGGMSQENHELGPSWESKSNTIADLFIMFMAWTSQKA